MQRFGDDEGGGRGRTGEDGFLSVASRNKGGRIVNISNYHRHYGHYHRWRLIIVIISRRRACNRPNGLNSPPTALRREEGGRARPMTGF